MKAVNLLPSDLRGAPKASAAITARSDVPRGPGAFIVLGALAFGVLALAGYVLTTNTIKDRQAQITQLAADQQAAEKRVAALKPYAQFDQLAKGRVATLKDLAGKRFDWDQALRDLSRALPQDVTIKSLSGTLGGATASPGAAQASRDHHAVDRPDRLHAQPEVGRAPDGAAVDRQRRDPRQARELEEVRGHGGAVRLRVDR